MLRTDNRALSVPGAAKPQRGFTLVEAIIVVVILVVLTMIVFPTSRERERQRLQALADVRPWEVFELRAEPVEETFAEGDEIVVHCEIVNLTGSPLTLPDGMDIFELYVGRSQSFAGSIREPGWNPKTAIGPRESASIDVSFSPIGTGAAEVLFVLRTEKAVYDHQGVTVSRGNKRLRVNAFQLVVTQGESSHLPTFDELIAEAMPVP